MNHYNHANLKHAKQLRKEMTPWERKLWYCYLNKYDVRFYRQKPIGKYIADFYCPKASLIIELDGGGHYDPESQKKDQERTMALEKSGLKVIRFCNTDIDRNFSGVCEAIDNAVKGRITCEQVCK